MPGNHHHLGRDVFGGEERGGIACFVGGGSARHRGQQTTKDKGQSLFAEQGGLRTVRLVVQDS